VAADLTHARALDAAGYPALWLTDPGLLERFEGSDIVLTEPGLHSLAFDLGGAFLVQCVDCWASGALDVVGTVPMTTHLLTLAEYHDVVPIQSSSQGKLAQQLYKAFELGQDAIYRRLARKVVSA
jgi:hypothetical protein